MEEKPAQRGHKEVVDSQKGSEAPSTERLQGTDGLDKTQRNLKVPSCISFLPSFSSLMFLLRIATFSSLGLGVRVLISAGLGD